MSPIKEADMSPQDRNQTTVTLSDKAEEELLLVAKWLNMPKATLMRQILEEHHRSPSFGNLVRRAKKEMEIPSDDLTDEDE